MSFHMSGPHDWDEGTHQGSASIRSTAESYLPNIPGYRRPPRQIPKKTIFNRIGGYVVTREDQLGRSSVFDSSGSAMGDSISIAGQSYVVNPQVTNTLAQATEEFSSDPKYLRTNRWYEQQIPTTDFPSSITDAGLDDEQSIMTDNQSVGTLNRPRRPRGGVNPSATDVILSFNAYFTERVMLAGSTDDQTFVSESHRGFSEDAMYKPREQKQKRHGENASQDFVVHACTLNYFPDDGSLRVLEKPVSNSGLQPGTLVARAVIYKPDGNPISQNDFYIGAKLHIYGRTIVLISCDLATIKWMQANTGIDCSQTLPLPQDSNMSYRERSDPGLSDSWGKFHSRKNDNKRFIEARLGHNADNSLRAGFVEYGSQKLKFKAIWDNRDNLFGDMTAFVVTYHLADNSMEIISMGTNSTDQQSPDSAASVWDPPAGASSDAQTGNGAARIKLLKKSQLPKNGEYLKQLGSSKASDGYYHWRDLSVGQSLNVYGRMLLIVDADYDTRQFYAQNGINLLSEVQFESSPPIIYKREIPPHTGFGSEEDSMRSVAQAAGQVPPVIRRGRPGVDKVLTYVARLETTSEDDIGRRFVISYHLSDDTVKIMEPPIRNSGFPGGTFLSRRLVHLHLPNGEKRVMQDTDFFVGARVKILTHVFVLLETNNTTLHWLETETRHPLSSPASIMTKLRQTNTIREIVGNGSLHRRFEEYADPSGGVTLDSFRNVLESFDLILPLGSDPSSTKLVEHELQILFRAGGNKSDTFDYHHFLSLL